MVDSCDFQFIFNWLSGFLTNLPTKRLANSGGNECHLVSHKQHYKLIS